MFPDGWLDPWIAEWQFVQPRLKSRTEFRRVGVVGWRLVRWQLSHTRGMRTFSNCGLLVPCASWQLAQFSMTGGCSHRKGPRLSVWQLREFSLVDRESTRLNSSHSPNSYAVFC